VYIVEVIWGNHFGILCNRSITDQYSAFIRYWGTKLKYSMRVHQLFMDFRKAYDSGEK